MTRKLNLPLLAVISTMLLVSITGSVVPQSQAGRVDPIKRPNNRGSALAASPKGWDGKVQGRQLVTPLVVTFNPKEYDEFAAGRLKLNVILKNTVSGQTISLPSNMLAENLRLRPTAGVISQQRLRPTTGVISQSINVVIDNMSAPLSEAACGEITPNAEKAADGFNIILSYSGCGSAQSVGGAVAGVIIAATSDNNRTAITGGNPGDNGRWIIITGERISGNITVVLGDSRVVTGGADAASAADAIIISSSRGAGSPKNAGF